MKTAKQMTYLKKKLGGEGAESDTEDQAEKERAGDKKANREDKNAKVIWEKRVSLKPLYLKNKPIIYIRILYLFLDKL